MRIIEIMGPDAAIVLPVDGDGGRERVIESVSIGLMQIAGVSSVSLIAQQGSYLNGINLLPVRFSQGMLPNVVLNEIFLTYGSSLSCDILHVHHPAYLAAAQFIRARKTVLTHHGDIQHSENFSADGVTFVSQFLHDWMCQDQPLVSRTTIAVIHNPVTTTNRSAIRRLDGPIGFMGAIDKPVKQVDIALDLALAVNHPILLAGNCTSEFLCQRITPKLSPRSRYLGMISGEKRQRFFDSISCMVVPSAPPEAFCLVAAEAMANGVPVLGNASGALPEVVEDLVSGYLCNGIDDYIDAFHRIHLISSADCQSSVTRRFSQGKIASQYFKLFSYLLQAKDPSI